MRKLKIAIFLMFASIFTYAQIGIQINPEALKNVSIEVSVHPLQYGFSDESTLGSVSSIENQLGLFNLGMSYNDMLSGDSIDSRIDLSQPFGHNGWQRTGYSLVLGYGWGSDIPAQTPHPWEFEIGFANGMYHQGSGVRSWISIDRKVIGSGMGSLSHESRFWYHISFGVITGVDASFTRSPYQTGVYNALFDKFLLDEDEYGYGYDIAKSYTEQIQKRMDYALPRRVGGTAFFVAPRVTVEEKFVVLDGLELFAQVSGQYDVIGKFLNKTNRAQHQANLSLGIRWYPFYNK